MSPKNRNVITAIVTNDYMHQAMVLWHSIQKFEKQNDFVLFVIGDDSNNNNDQQIGFSVLDAKKLFAGKEPGNLSWKQFLFQYHPKEAACALKPLAILYLLQKYEKVICLDTDMKLFRPLEAAWKGLEKSDLSLTVHYHSPIPAGWCDEQFRLLVRLSGIFNSGYIGATSSGSSFLRWWWEQTKHNCITSLPHGIFAEQRWLDAAVGFVKRLHVMQYRSYNVGSWNFHERELHKKRGHYFVNEEPLVLFHFAGFKKENDFPARKKGEPLFFELFRQHEKELACEKKKFLDKKYPFHYFQDGELIDSSWRNWMRRGIPELEKIKDPFALSCSEREEIEEIMVKRSHQFRPKLDRET